MHRQNMIDDKSVDADKHNNQLESQHDIGKQDTSTTKNDVNAKEIGDEYVSMRIPEQPKRQAPVTPAVETPSSRQKSLSLKTRRKAPAPPAKSRSFSG